MFDAWNLVNGPVGHHGPRHRPYDPQRGDAILSRIPEPEGRNVSGASKVVSEEVVGNQPPSCVRRTTRGSQPMCEIADPQLSDLLRSGRGSCRDDRPLRPGATGVLRVGSQIG